MNNTKFIIDLTRGIIRNRDARRKVMTYIIGAALVLLFIGSLLFSWLASMPVLFLLFWGACAWLTLLSILLALFDLLQVRRDARIEKRALERKLICEQELKDKL